MRSPARASRVCGESARRSLLDLERSSGETAQFLVHLGMTGRLLVSDAELPWPPHTHAVLTLSDGRELRFVDPRRFGRLSVVRDDPYAGPGSEPTTISPDAFAKLFRGRKLAIKAALLNQSLLHGVGNIYADEALFRAGIRPRKAAGRLTRAELDRLHQALQEVLARAIELGGSSISDYVDAAGAKGFFQIEHKVYGRAGEPCAQLRYPAQEADRWRQDHRVLPEVPALSATPSPRSARR